MEHVQCAVNSLERSIIHTRHPQLLSFSLGGKCRPRRRAAGYAPRSAARRPMPTSPVGSAGPPAPRARRGRYPPAAACHPNCVAAAPAQRRRRAGDGRQWAPALLPDGAGLGRADEGLAKSADRRALHHACPNTDARLDLAAPVRFPRREAQREVEGEATHRCRRRTPARR